jgi:hypothetical protein
MVIMGQTSSQCHLVLTGPEHCNGRDGSDSPNEPAMSMVRVAMVDALAIGCQGS